MTDDVKRHLKGELLTAEGAATLLGCSVATLYRHARKGNFPTTRVLGRNLFERSDVEMIEVHVRARRK